MRHLLFRLAAVAAFALLVFIGYMMWTTHHMNKGLVFIVGFVFYVCWQLAKKPSS